VGCHADAHEVIGPEQFERLFFGDGHVRVPSLVER